MDKKDILEQYKNKNNNSLDEREKKIYNYSFGVGAVVVGVLCLVFSVYCALQHRPFYEFVAIITAYLSTVFFYQFRNLKHIGYLIAAIVTGAGAVASIIMFFTGV